jgi:hypothetical protein
MNDAWSVVEDRSPRVRMQALVWGRREKQDRPLEVGST